MLKWLERRNVDPAVLAAVARHQLLVPIVICFGTFRATIGARGSGGLTGSKLAGLLARVPVESTFQELRGELWSCAFKAPNTDEVCDGSCPRLAADSWVDNLYFFSSSVTDVTVNAELVASHLRDIWGLSIKPSSKQILLPFGTTCWKWMVDS